MKVDFSEPIRTLDGEAVQEPVYDYRGQPKLSEEEMPFPDLDSAHRFGRTDAFVKDGKVKAIAPEVKTVTLGMVCVRALVMNWPGETLSPETSFDRWRMAGKIKDACEGDGMLDLTREDLAFLLATTDNFGRSPNRIVVFFARAREMLDPDRETFDKAA